MSGRVNPFADLKETPAFAVKPKPMAVMAKEGIDKIAEDNGFLSRPAVKTPKETKRKKRIYTTGRNRQINVKVSDKTLDLFYKLADEQKVSLCELLELALDALAREGDAEKRQDKAS